MKRAFILTPLIILYIGLVFIKSAGAGQTSILHVNIEIIKAHRDSAVVDPQLKGLIKELGPILNFSGFSLIKKSKTALKVNDKTRLILSHDRHVELKFLEFDDYKARLSLRILEKKKETFKTVLLLIDNGSALIGGPPHEGGTLLLRIKAKFE